MAPKITFDELHALLHYDMDSGEFVWKVNKGSRARIGNLAGCVQAIGYVVIRLNKRMYYAHHLAWMWCFGEWPAGELDHRDRDPSNNRITNLRDAGQSVNLSNRRQIRSDVLTGIIAARGKIAGRWDARIRVPGTRTTLKLGVYATQEEAHAAFRVAHIAIYGIDSQYAGLNDGQ